MTTLHMKAVALTPIHVGDGTELGLESYVLRQGFLCRFEATDVVQQLERTARQSYLEKLNRGQLHAALSELRAAITDPQITERIAISAQSSAELGKAVENPLRSGHVHPFIRTAGRPFIPGSSIKGALRTALASHFVAQDKIASDDPSHESAMRTAFQLARDDTADDPLRFMRVADVLVPDGGTQIDAASVIGRADDTRSRQVDKIQMHYERLVSYIDDPRRAPRLELTIAIDDDVLARQRRESAGLRVPRTVTPTVVFRAVNAFHGKLWQQEMQRFFAARPPSQRRMEAALGPQAASIFAATAANNMLLRIGRFGHFESKSLDGLRSGDIRLPGGRRERRSEGGTRTVAKIGGDAIPFGWLLAWVEKRA